MIPLLFFLCSLLVKQTVVAIRETSRLFSVSKSPIVSNMGEAISGASTIRAFGLVKDFETRNNKVLDDNIAATMMMGAVNSYFAVRLDLITFFITMVVALICIFLRESVNPVMLSLLLSYSLNIQYCVYALLKLVMNIEAQMV